MSLRIPRELNIGNAEDRRLLREVGASAEQLDPSLLIDDHLDEYLSLFHEPHWRRVSRDGHLILPGMRHGKIGFEFRRMLEVVRTLRPLQAYAGFAELMNGFRNPFQFFPTLFEVDVAAWCAERACTREIVFAPEVLVRGHMKKPEFLWITQLGELYCECKQAQEHESKLNRRAHQLAELLDAAHEAYEPWPEGWRVDVLIASGPHNGIEGRLRRAVAALREMPELGEREVSVHREEVIATLVEASKVPVQGDLERGAPDRMHTWIVRVASTPTRVDEPPTRLVISVAKFRSDTVVRLLRDAKTQLPIDRASAIFIQLGGVDSAAERLRSVLGHASYAMTPWVAVWGKGVLRAVWRNGQPFDGRLTEPK